MTQLNGSNHLWGRLDTDPRLFFRGLADEVELDTGATLVRAGDPTRQLHFVERGLLSVISEGAGVGVEVGLIGRDGLSGTWLALGQEVSPFRVVVQASGSAFRVSADVFREACAERPEFHAAVLRYAQDLMGMVAETCLATARMTLEGRLARWLLMAHDRLDGDDIAITHDTLSKMLGVRRPGVTVATHILEGEGMIRARRGAIRILDRSKLGAVASGFYRSGATSRREPTGAPAYA